MHIKCNRAALYEAVQLAASIVPARTPKPILTCAQLKAQQEGQKLTVTATDNEITINYLVAQVQVVSSGSAVLPADRLAAILHESSDETIELQVSQATCKVLGRDSRFNIFGHDPEDFPVISTPATDYTMKISAAALKRMIHLSAFATARESTRYAINGVLWEQKGKKLRMVATDGRRLAQVDGTLISAAGPEENTAIVPVKTMTILERILHDEQEKIEIQFTENQIIARTALIEMTSNLVQGRFPKYSDVIPTGCERKAQLEKEVFHSAVRRGSLLTTELSRGIQMAFSQEELVLFSSTPEAGDAEIKMKVKYDGEDTTIRFNPPYLLDMLRIIEEPELTCEFIDGSKPGLFRAGKDFVYVIMPVTG